MRGTFIAGARTMPGCIGLVVVAGCGGATVTAPAPTVTATATTTVTATATPTVSASDPCSLATNPELVRVVGTTPSRPQQITFLRYPACRWIFKNAQGSVTEITVASLPASEWIRALPSLRELAQQVKNDEEVDKIIASIKGGFRGTDAEACDIYSRLLELQGQPAGRRENLTTSGDPERPRLLAAQICSGGRFTSAGIGNRDGMARPLPSSDLLDLRDAVHRRALVAD